MWSLKVVCRSVLTPCYFAPSPFRSLIILLILWELLEQDHKSVFNVGFELFGEQYRTFQALQQDGAAGAVDGGGGDRHQRDPCSDQQYTGAAAQERIWFPNFQQPSLHSGQSNTTQSKGGWPSTAGKPGEANLNITVNICMQHQA